MGPREEPICPTPPCALSSRPPRKQIENHQISSLSPRHQKSLKLVPRPSNNKTKSHRNQENPNICEELDFAEHLILQQMLYLNPGCPNSEPRNREPTCSKCGEQVPKCGPKIQAQSDRNPRLDPKVSLLVLPSAPVSFDGPPRCQSGRDRCAK